MQPKHNIQNEGAGSFQGPCRAILAYMRIMRVLVGHVAFGQTLFQNQ